MRTGVTAAVLFLSCLAFAEGLSADTFETGSYVIDMGQPTRTSFFRLVFYFLLNVIHLVLWIALLWLVLRFAPGHAVLLGFVLWLVFTLAVFPLLFSQAAGVVG